MLADVAERVARKYARKVWWASLDELRQEALLACFLAERTWDAEVGVPLEAYAWTCAWRSVGRWLLRNSSIVSASWGKVGDLAHLCSVPVDESAHDVAPWADAVLDDKRWRASVREEVLTVLAHGGMSEADQRLALEVLVQGRAPSEVAQSSAVPIAQVKKARRRAARLVLQDFQCYRLWRERNQR
jgi:DNA-directed RNA polymerase specialized sigma24 family protein